MGSFLNVVGLRVPVGKSFISNERSACPHCDHQLKWYELIPIVSYTLQGGKCRKCKAPIGVQYPAMEVATGTLYALSYNVFGLTWGLALSLTLVSMLVTLWVTDIKYLLIPNKILLFFAPFLLLFKILSQTGPWWEPFVAGLVGFTIVFVIILVSKGGMGGGDLKLFAVLGLALGVPATIATFLVSCIIGAAWGAILLATKKMSKEKPFPFGPSIILAALLFHYYGGPLINWYMNLM